MKIYIYSLMSPSVYSIFKYTCWCYFLYFGCPNQDPNKLNPYYMCVQCLLNLVSQYILLHFFHTIYLLKRLGSLSGAVFHSLDFSSCMFMVPHWTSYCVLCISCKVIGKARNLMCYLFKHSRCTCIDCLLYIEYCYLYTFFNV